MDSILASYTPLDLTTIQKSLPKSLRKINTDKDLETEVQDIAGKLKDLSKYILLFIHLSTHFNFSNRLENADGCLFAHLGTGIPV